MLIGRTTELAAVAGALDGLAAGSPFVLAFAGDEGSGRSSLLDAATKQARDAGAMVLAARGSGVEPGPAYSGLLALLRPLEPVLDDLAAPEHVAAVQSALAIRNDSVDAVDVGIGVLRVLAGAAESRSVVLVLDDAAAIDPASTTSIAFALARIGVDPIGAFLGMPTAPSAWDDVVTRRVVLGPLGVSDLVAIVQHATDCGSDAARACAEWAGGSPMLAVELASSLSDDERSGRSPLPAVPRATVRVVERLQQGLDALSERARRALAVVAASRSERVSVILRALDALGEPPGGLDEAEDAGHVTLGGGIASFTHPLLEPLSYHLVAASSRRAAHRALAGALVEPRDAVERAWHLAESCVGPDEDVAAALDLVAADARRRGALIESAATLERGAALSPEPASAAARRRAAAVAALDGFDFDAALRLVDPADPDDEEAAWLAIEAVERRDGESAALGALATRPESPADVLADLLVGTGRRADAAKELDDRARDAARRRRSGRARPGISAPRRAGRDRRDRSPGPAQVVAGGRGSRALSSEPDVGRRARRGGAGRRRSWRCRRSPRPGRTRARHGAEGGDAAARVVARGGDTLRRGRRDGVVRTGSRSRDADQGRAAGRRVGRGGPDEQGGRRPPVRQCEDRRLPLAGHLSQVGGPVTDRTGRADGPGCRLAERLRGDPMSVAATNLTVNRWWT